jgi:hypothetical protein
VPVTLSLGWGFAHSLRRWLMTASFLPITAVCSGETILHQQQSQYELTARRQETRIVAGSLADQVWAALLISGDWRTDEQSKHQTRSSLRTWTRIYARCLRLTTTASPHHVRLWERTHHYARFPPSATAPPCRPMKTRRSPMEIGAGMCWFLPQVS